MMHPLDKTLRKQLENTVKKARVVAEKAAYSALEQLGVGAAIAFTHLSEDEKKLRRQLRVHGRQLGDKRDPQKETQEVVRLAEEVAYEHWHRMLFARFLAENNLLMYPDPIDPVPVTLEECEDLAADEGAKNGWELAARYAGEMLPQIFRLDSPAFTLTLPPEHQQALEKLLTDLPVETFQASDSLGWVYQFWQAKRKDEVNASEVKIGARELPAVTQLFTEPYMVDFLLDNSLGAWWAGKRLSEDDFKTAKSEEELRVKASIDGVPLKYLRFVQDEEGAWSPASGKFEQWPERLSELKTLDPSCGSGHFLVAAMLMLIPMRMEMEGLSVSEAVNAVLRDNINGLDIDPRVTEIAAFALAITAWRVGGYQELPELNIACSGLSVSAKKSEWLALAEGNQELEGALDKLYDLFKDAPVLGSLLDPSKLEASLFSSGYDNVAQLLEDALKTEKSDVALEAGITAHGLAKAANLLAGKYQWVITNVPYLGIRKQTSTIRNFCEEYYPIAKHDLATVFIIRILELVSEGGSSIIVSPNLWMFLSSYIEFRKKLLTEFDINFISNLGEGGFESSAAAGAFVSLAIVSNLSYKNSNMKLLDLSENKDITYKKNSLKNSIPISISHTDQLLNPDSKILKEAIGGQVLLEDYANSLAGIQNGDSPRFIREFWEILNRNSLWWPIHNAPTSTKSFAGMSSLIYYDMDNGHLREIKDVRRGRLHDSDQRGKPVWGKKGALVSRMRSLPSTVYSGNLYDQNAAAIVPILDKYLLPVITYCLSDEFTKNVRKVDSKINVTNATLAKIPFDLEHWTKVAEEKYPNGLPKPYSNDPTQWIFHGYPSHSDSPLQVAVARLLGYQWPAELDEEMELSNETRSLIEKSKTLNSYADEDGIVCIPAIRGEQAADERLLSLLAAAYSSEWSNDVLTKLLSEVEMTGKTLEVWLREKFFMQHSKLFGHRPFIWHIWDGLKDGFAALVNYHKLDYKTLETLIYTYLGDWISRQKQDVLNGIDGAEEKLAAAKQLKTKLEHILVGEQPHDIFVRWKSLEEQSIGWNPDINDGVRMNIRPFMTAPDVAKKGAGVLRDKPNIKWGKDRGKDVSSAPWYNLGIEYGGKEGDRINDHHLSLEEKKVARENKDA